VFDLVTGNVDRPLRERAPGSKIISIAGHAALITAVIAMSVMTTTVVVPKAPAMMAFVTAAPPPPPPPPLAVA